MPRAQILYYRSRLDEILQPLPICATDEAPVPKPLILDLSPGAIADLGQSALRCQQLVAIAGQAGEAAVIAKPCGRGPGSVYQGPGEVDLFEAIDFICQNFAIDPDRISLMGGSMGGAATWYVASHYPDRFAAAAPFCGYCDFRLWTKPGGLIMRTQPWEEYSWESRGAAFRAENLTNMALWMTHGEWDIGIGGGVPLAHSQQMAQRFDELGMEYRYTVVPECGHGCMTDEQLNKVIPWLCQQRRPDQPQHVRLTAHSLRHNRAYWLGIEQFAQYGQPARADAHLKGETLNITTENVQTLTIGPIKGQSAVAVAIDTVPCGTADLSRQSQTYIRQDERWQCSTDGANLLGKRHRSSGPCADLFFEPLCFVKGTKGSPQENFYQDWLAGVIPSYFKSTNGGVHRGIFHGETWYELEVVEDADITDDTLQAANLILWGTDRSNAVLAQIIDQLPLSFEADGITLGGRRFIGADVGLAACFPSPFNPQRLVAVIGGITPISLTQATHLNLQLLPDYLVWDGDQVLAHGHFDGTFSTIE